MNGDTKLRVFVALEPSAEIREALVGLQDQLAATGLPLRFTRPEGIHMTLAFIGEIAGRRLDELTAAVEHGAAGFRAFDLRADGVGAFPTRRRPRTLWLGIEGDADARAALQGLHNSVTTALRAAGFHFDGKFDPHLTIARVQKWADAAQVQQIAEVLSTLRLANPVPFRVDAIYIMSSVLQPGGSVYTPLATVSLQNNFAQGRGG